MTEPRFDELINLYLDNEIGRHELGELKQAMQSNLLRRRKFERACELHQAARKALTTRAGQAQNAPAASAGGVGVATTAGAAPPVPPTVTHEAGRPRSAHPAGGKGWLKKKQGQAHRNASVTALADRQSQKGAASEVDISKISLEPSRFRKPVGSVRAFTFFHSPLGMLMGAVLTLIGGFGLYFFLKVASPESDAESAFKTPPSVIHQPDVTIDPRVLKELPVSTIVNTPPSGAAATNEPAPPSGSALPSSTSLSAANLGQPMLNGLPDSLNLPPGQEDWVRLSMPTLLPTAPTLEDKTKPADTTPPPVTLP